MSTDNSRNEYGWWVSAQKKGENPGTTQQRYAEQQPSATGVKKWVASRWVYFILLRWSASSAAAPAPLASAMWTIICFLSTKHMHAPSLRSGKTWANFNAVDDIATAATWYFPQLILTVGSVPLIGCVPPVRPLHAGFTSVQVSLVKSLTPFMDVGFNSYSAVYS